MASSDTVYFAGKIILCRLVAKYADTAYQVTDKWGNACSFTQSNYTGLYQPKIQTWFITYPFRLFKPVLGQEVSRFAVD